MVIKKWIKALFAIGLALAILYFLGHALADNLDGLADSEFRIRPGYLALSFIFLVVYFLLLALRWRKILLLAGERFRILDGIKVWFCSQLGKYIPFKVMTVIGRVYLANRLGVSKTRGTVSMVLEIQFQIISGLILFVIALAFRGSDSAANLWILLLLPAGLVAVHPWVVNKMLALGMRMLKRDPVTISLTVGQMAKMIVAYTGLWLIYGLSNYFLLLGVDLDPAHVGNFLVITGTFSVAWVVGYVSFIVPSGLGVRELTATGLLSLALPDEMAAMAVIIPLMGRLLWTVAEVGGAFYFRSGLFAKPKESGGPLNVAVVAACPFPGNRGTPCRGLRMAEALAERGHQVHVVTYHYGTDTPTRGITVHRIPNVGGVNFASGPSYRKLLLFDPLLVLLLSRVIRKHKIDVIHGQHFEGALVGFAARRFRNIPVIYDAHTTLAGELNHYRFPMPQILKDTCSRELDRAVPDTSDHVIAVSDTLREFLMEQGIDSGKINVVPSGVRLDEFDHGDAKAVVEKYGLDPNKVVLYTGSTATFQGVPHLIDAMPGVLAAEPEALFLIVGDDPHGALSAQAERLGVADRLIVTGERPFEEMADWLATGRVAVIPRTDCPGIPQKLCNYMAARKPIVSFAGSAKLLTHEANGLVVPDGDTGAMADAIVRLLRDTDLSQRLGEAARTSLNGRYDWPSLAQKTEAIYWDLVARE